MAVRTRGGASWHATEAGGTGLGRLAREQAEAIPEAAEDRHDRSREHQEEPEALHGRGRGPDQETPHGCAEAAEGHTTAKGGLAAILEP